MADKCVPTNYCGTHYPGWLSGSHPTVAEGVVTRKVCYHYWYYYWYGTINCCYYSNNIRVRNCGAFFVYELQKPPRCDLRYCGNASGAGKLPCLLFRKFPSTISRQATNSIIAKQSLEYSPRVVQCNLIFSKVRWL